MGHKNCSWTQSQISWRGIWAYLNFLSEEDVRFLVLHVNTQVQYILVFFANCYNNWDKSMQNEGIMQLNLFTKIIWVDRCPDSKVKNQLDSFRLFYGTKFTKLQSMKDLESYVKSKEGEEEKIIIITALPCMEEFRQCKSRLNSKSLFPKCIVFCGDSRRAEQAKKKYKDLVKDAKWDVFQISQAIQSLEQKLLNVQQKQTKPPSQKPSQKLPSQKPLSQKLPFQKPSQKPLKNEPSPSSLGIVQKILITDDQTLFIWVIDDNQESKVPEEVNSLLKKKNLELKIYQLTLQETEELLKGDIEQKEIKPKKRFMNLIYSSKSSIDLSNDLSKLAGSFQNIKNIYQYNHNVQGDSKIEEAVRVESPNQLIEILNQELNNQ